jgi:hypothetical protein
MKEFPSHQNVNLFPRLAKGSASKCNYEINFHQYNKSYYLDDDLYPKWSASMKTISNPLGHKKSHLDSRWESCMKKIERVFGVLKACFAMVSTLLLAWVRFRYVRS